MYATELQTLLERSKSGKTGLVFHLQGTTVTGVVREIHADAVLVSNQEYGRILVRLDAINAVSAHA